MTDTQPLYDLAPVFELMLLGLVIALGPLVWVWARNRGSTPMRRLQALTVLTLFLTFDLVLFGAFTRLTDSGLGCPDWPGCYGSASPLGAHAEITEAQTAMPTGPVTHRKAWIEMIHRYLATGVGALMTVLMIWSALAVRRLRRSDPAAAARIAQHRRYLMCAPEYFTVSYRINPWMEPAKPTDTAKAVEQWQTLYDTYLALGHEGELIDPVEGLPDMVYTANGGFIIDGRALGVRFRVDERRGMAEMKYALRVTGFDQLSGLLGQLLAVPNVIEARRVA